MGKLSSRKILFLRIGIDLGCGGTLGPIYPDRTFEYVPIPDDPQNVSPKSLFYADIKSTYGGTLDQFIPKRFRNHPAHYDPEFETYTYGDPTKNKSRQLLHLKLDDILVFYAGLRPPGQNHGGRIYIIGYFEIKSVEEVYLTIHWPPTKFKHLFANAHFRRAEPDEGLVVVQGKHETSRLLIKAFLISDDDQYILPKMEEFLGIHGSLKRSIGRWVSEEKANRVIEWLFKL